MRKIIYSILIGISLISCTERREYVEALEHAQTLLDEQPDSALLVLENLSIHKNKMQKSTYMKLQLLKLQALNKTDAQMDTASPILEVTDYYNSHGNHHDRMMSNYLMGRYYADKGNAPQALQFYREAIRFSDTTSVNCDYRNLSRIYGQIATLFHMQRSPRLELEAEKNAVYYARKANDIITSLIFFEHLSAPYHLMNMNDSALFYCKAASDSFFKYGYKNLAVGCKGLIIEDYIKQGKKDSAKLIIKEFEQYSGAFNTNSQIQQGREIFYYLKGRIYELYNQYDSAVTLYNTLLSSSDRIDYKETAYKGLMSVYSQLSKPDSVMKYASLYANANDSSNIKHSAEEISRLQAVYNYNESQYIAQIEKDKAKRRLMIIYILIAISFIVGIWLVVRIRNFQKRKQVQLTTVSRRYCETLNEYTQAKQDLKNYLEGYDEYRHKKETEIDNLKQALSVFIEDNARLEAWDIEDALLNAAIVKNMHNLAIQGKTITDAQWEDFEILVASKLGSFYNKINAPQFKLTDNEKKACMLIRLRFIPSELAVFMDLSNQRVTNIRTSINKKLFGEKGTRMLDTNIRRLN